MKRFFIAVIALVFLGLAAEELQAQCGSRGGFRQRRQARQAARGCSGGGGGASYMPSAGQGGCANGVCPTASAPARPVIYARPDTTPRIFARR